MLTGDLNIAEVEWIVQYQIRDAEEFLYRVRNPADNLRDLAESAMRLVVGDYSITDVLTERRADIEQEVEENIQQAEERVELCRAEFDGLQEASDHVESQKRWARLEAARQRVAELYTRWEELETKAE